MKKLILGIAVFLISMYGIILLALNGAHPRWNGFFQLLIVMALAGFCLCLWDVFLEAPFKRWRNNPIELEVLLNGKRIVVLECMRYDKTEMLYARAMAMEEVKQALDGKKLIRHTRSRLEGALRLETK